MERKKVLCENTFIGSLEECLEYIKSDYDNTIVLGEWYELTPFSFAKHDIDLYKVEIYGWDSISFYDAIHHMFYE